MGDKRTLLIIRDLAGGPRRFVELQRVLPGISTEQLRSRLNRMVADGLLTRQRYREVPPRVDYELTERAREVLPIVGALATWGRQWAWSPPREGEAVDIGAIFRASTGLRAGDARQTGSVELVVDERGYTMRVTGGGIGIAEQASPDADARIAGTLDDWIAALGPEPDAQRLAVSGDAALAGTVLELVGGAALAHARVA